jgi:hypothetical protein
MRRRKRSLDSGFYLENHLQAKLKHAWSAAAKAGISLRDVGSLRDQALIAASIRITLHLPIGIQAGIEVVIRLREVRVVEDVEELGAKLQSEPLAE